MIDERTDRKLLWLAIVIVVICLVAIIGIARAGDAVFKWTHDGNATGYHIYVGTQSGVYGPAIDAGKPTPIGTTYKFNVATLLDGCVPQYGAITAYSYFGDSGYSNEVGPFVARPIITGEPVLSPDETNILLSGGNFSSGITVQIDGQAVPFQRTSCEMLAIPVVSVPATQGQTAVMELCNGSICMQKLLIPATKPTQVGVE